MSHPPYQSMAHQTPYSGSDGGRGDRASVLINAIKDVASQDIPDADTEEDKPSSLKLDGLKCDGVRVIKSFGFAVSVYRLTNTSVDTRELVENSLQAKNALAIATDQRALKPDESTLLFVARPL